MSEDLRRIVDWLLSKQSMSPKKLQKLLYYSQAWAITLLNESPDQLRNRLFNEDFEAWVHGPVIPQVYHEFKQYGYNNIPKKDTEVELSEDLENVLEQVMEVYGDFNGNEPENITHQEDPWIHSRKGYNALEKCNEVITPTDMFTYYIKRAN